MGLGGKHKMPARIPYINHFITGKKTTGEYLRMQEWMGKFYLKDFFCKFDQINNFGRFLEIGSGPGYQTTLVKEKYQPRELIGLEYSTDMIRVAEEYSWVKRISDNIKYIHGTVEDKSLIQSLGRFDLIYSTFSFHRWSDAIQGIDNLYKALNPNGILFLYDFYRGGLFYYLNVNRGLWESVRASYRPEEVRQMLTTLGIENYFIRHKGLYMDLVVKKES